MYDPNLLPMSASAREQDFQAKRSAPRGPRGEVAWADPDRLFSKSSGAGQYNPSLLISRKGMSLLDKIRNDDQVFACMTLKKLAAIGSGWEIKSPEGKDTEQINDVTGAKEIEKWEPTRFIQWCLESFLEETLEQALMEIMGGFDYGYSVVEKVLSEVALGEWKGKVGLKALKGRKPHGFDFEVDAYGNLLALKQQTAEGQLYYPPEKFVLYSHFREWGNWYGASDYEVAYRAWWLKDNLYRWMAIDSERYAIPMVVLTYNENGVAATFNSNIQGILTSLSAGSSMTLPRRDISDIDLQVIDAKKGSAGKSDVLVQRIINCNQDVARALLMPGLLGVTADSETGSLARAQTHFDVFMLVMDHIRTILARQIVDKQIVEYLFDINYGIPEDGLYPFFEFNPMTDEQIEAIAAVWEKMVNVGVLKPQKTDEAHWRRLLEGPEIEEGRDEADPEGDGSDDQPPADPPGGDAAPGDDPAPPSGDEPEDVEEDDPKDEEEGGKKFASFSMSRKPNSFERSVNFAAIEDGLNAQEKMAADGMREALLTTRERLIKGVLNQKEITQSFVDNIQFTVGKAAFEAHLRNLLRNAYDFGGETIRREVGKVEGEKFAKQRGPNYVPRDAARFLKSRAVRTTLTTYEPLRLEVARALAMALEQGLTPQKITQRLRDIFEPYVGNKRVLKGGKPIADYRLEAIVRTESTAAFNQGRLVQLRDPAIEPFIQGAEFAAVIDDRTTDVCRMLDGRILRKDDGSWDELSPPRHVNCRSILVGVTTSDTVKADLFLGADEVGEAKRISGRGFSVEGGK